MSNSKRTIPGPRGHWLFGDLPEFRAGMLAFLERCRRDYGPVAAFRLGPRRLILVSEPALIEEVVVTKNKDFRKHYATRLLTPVLGKGLLLSEGEQWLRQRRLVQPAFSRRFTKQFAEIVRRHAARLAQTWTADPHRDLYRDMTMLTVQIAAQAFLGVEDTEVVAEIGHCLETIHSDFEHRFLHPFTPAPWIPTPRNRRLRAAVATLTDVIDRMIECRRGGDEGRDALALLLAARDEHGDGIPRQLLRDEVMTLLLAGHDTTANSLTWTWSLLAQHPEIMDKVSAAAANCSDDPANCRPDSEQGAYLHRVTKESMRLYPPVYLFGREALRDVEIGGYRIRRGENVVMSQWVVHRDAEFFPQPEVFNPDRWTAAFEADLPRHAYFPFGGGPRICVGKEMALIESAVILARLASEFTVRLDAPERDVVPWPTVTLRPRGRVSASICRKATAAAHVH